MLPGCRSARPSVYGCDRGAAGDRPGGEVGMELLIFETAAARYALPIDQVVEVLRAAALAPLPEGPSIVEGVVNLRGAAVPVVDLRRRFGQPLAAVHPDDHFIVARTGQRTVIFRAESRTQLRQVPAGAVDRGVDVVAGMEVVAGMVRLPDGIALLHDVDTFLTQAEATALAHALIGAGDAGADPDR